MLQHGIDLHKYSLTVATVDASGTLLARKRMPARRGELSRYLSSWGTRNEPQQATVECTGSWYWVADLCRTVGVDFHLAHAQQVKAIAAAKVKTDAVDACTLAQLLRTDFLPEAHVVAADRREQRDLLRTRVRLVARRTAAKNSIARIFEKYNVARVDQLPALAQAQVAIHQEQIGLLTAQARALVRLAWQQLRDDRWIGRLLQIPGIGIIGALSLRLELDAIQRFASERHFFSYCRLVPGASDSGARRRHKPSKAGNRYLKLTFSHAAIRAIHHYPTIRAFYQHTARRKNRFIARALVAKELSRIVYYVLTHDVDYNGTFKGTPLSTPKRITQVKRPHQASPETGVDSSRIHAERVEPRS